jgi:predicted esterase
MLIGRTELNVLIGALAALGVLTVSCSPDEAQTDNNQKLPVAPPIGSGATPTGFGGLAGAQAPGRSGVPDGVPPPPTIPNPSTGLAGAPAQPMPARGMTAPGAPPAPPAPAMPAMPAAASMIPMAMGPNPPLPMVMGECPDISKNGTIMAAGHKSIVIAAGAVGKAGPLLFYWHGTGSSASESNMFPGRSEIIAAGGIVAAFNGNQSSGKGSDCSGTGAHNMADFDAADVIAACAVKSGQVDARRIYSTGCSAGGLQTGCMAQVRSSYLAAVAPNSGGLVFSQAWQDTHTPAVFTMHGGSTDMVIVTFSQTSATFDMAAKSHGGFVVNCDHGGGHCQAPAELQRSAWQFMKDHPWGAESPWKAGIPMGVPAYCKIY